MSGIQPRPYQIEAVKAVKGSLGRGRRRTAVVLPTGTGKTVVIAAFVRDWRDGFIARPVGRRVLAIAHRTELIEQLRDKVRDVAPGLSVGIVQGQSNETRADVVVASVQTLLSENRRRMIDDVGLIIVDECHHAVAESYLRVLKHYGAWGDEPAIGQAAQAIAVGFTATMSRGDDKALGEVWEEICYSKSIAEMVRCGYLVRPRGLRVRVDDLDLSQVKVSRGDYAEGELGRAITESLAPQAIAKAIREHAPGRPGLIFAPTVEAARVIADAVAEAGFNIDFVHGGTPPEQRRAMFRAFRDGRLDWISNCAIATEGTDLPRAEVAVIARPTKSSTLYVQMAGRVLRPSPGKADALLLDVVGASKLHSLQGSISLFGEESVGIREPVLDGDVGLVEDLEPLDDGMVGADTAFDLADLRGAGRDGPLVSEEIDLFSGSHSAWMRTHGGTWFLSAGERYIAIVAGVEAGTYDVATMDKKRVGTGRWVINGLHDLSWAMAWAEGEVTPAEKTTAARARSWRREGVTDKQRMMAARCGITIPPSATKGEVSSWLDIEFASARIDPHTPAYARGR